MAKTKKTDFFNGNSGNVWVRGEQVGQIIKGSISKQIEYEDVPLSTGGNARVEVGHKFSIAITYKKIGSENVKAFSSSDDIDVILANKNMSGEKQKRFKAIGVTFDEETLIDFEKRKVQEVELKGECEDVQELQ
ncbi:phage tail tube protein [Fusobacterium sp. IOR10]|uniref:phage tail tube protein n=1 Tax=Fusobacterium sp. IOR10 TaxID=2665157 RepID=UPI0013D0F38A|nr:phage tail tube protein [Fusobacterium sp. IOR10]